jgi:soluble lytic murein transglycosylase-like protein
VRPRASLWLLLAALACLLVVRNALADEGIARRLAALRSLTRPDAAAVLPAEPPAGGGLCTAARAAWWRQTEYGVRARIRTAVRDASLRYGLDPRLLESVIRSESNYDVDAVSRVGAMGLMQLMPGTAGDLDVVCAFDPRENVLAGARYLRRLHDRFRSWPRALAGYHAGPERVASGRIPAVTRRYVAEVLERWQPHRAQAPPIL